MFTEARKTEIKSQLLVAANTLTSSRAARLEVDLAPNEKPSEKDLVDLRRVLWRQIGSYRHRTFRISHIRTHGGRNYVELLIEYH